MSEARKNHYFNVTLDAETYDLLLKEQERMEAKLGIQVKRSQVAAALIAKGLRLEKAAEGSPAD